MGALALARMLKVNNTLRSLNLQYNSIGDSGADALQRAIREFNTTLTTLNVSNNNLSPFVVRAINSALDANRLRQSDGDVNNPSHPSKTHSGTDSPERLSLPAITAATSSLTPETKPPSKGSFGRQNRRFQEAFLDAPTKRRTTQLTLNKYGCDLAR
mmetsp:Transcript_48856/g.97914  ORF Transcript_48856/g.97914 Transcript_48856/m.97914 type:complete len:157 (+) Transcript_48856:100-570(+)